MKKFIAILLFLILFPYGASGETTAQQQQDNQIDARAITNRFIQYKLRKYQEGTQKLFDLLKQANCPLPSVPTQSFIKPTTVRIEIDLPSPQLGPPPTYPSLEEGWTKIEEGFIISEKAKYRENAYSCDLAADETTNVLTRYCRYHLLRPLQGQIWVRARKIEYVKKVDRDGKPYKRKIEREKVFYGKEGDLRNLFGNKIQVRFSNACASFDKTKMAIKGESPGSSDIYLVSGDTKTKVGHVSCYQATDWGIISDPQQEPSRTGAPLYGLGSIDYSYKDNLGDITKSRIMIQVIGPGGTFWQKCEGNILYQTTGDNINYDGNKIFAIDPQKPAYGEIIFTDPTGELPALTTEAYLYAIKGLFCDGQKIEPGASRVTTSDYQLSADQPGIKASHFLKNNQLLEYVIQGPSCPNDPFKDFKPGLIWSIKANGNFPVQISGGSGFAKKGTSWVATAKIQWPDTISEDVIRDMIKKIKESDSFFTITTTLSLEFNKDNKYARTDSYYMGPALPVEDITITPRTTDLFYPLSVLRNRNNAPGAVIEGTIKIAGTNVTFIMHNQDSYFGQLLHLQADKGAQGALTWGYCQQESCILVKGDARPGQIQVRAVLLQQDLPPCFHIKDNKMSLISNTVAFNINRLSVFPAAIFNGPDKRRRYHLIAEGPSNLSPYRTEWVFDKSTRGAGFQKAGKGWDAALETEDTGENLKQINMLSPDNTLIAALSPATGTIPAISVHTFAPSYFVQGQKQPVVAMIYGLSKQFAGRTFCRWEIPNPMDYYIGPPPGIKEIRESPSVLLTPAIPLDRDSSTCRCQMMLEPKENMERVGEECEVILELIVK